MHGLRCIITAYVQPLFNQMYGRKGSSLIVHSPPPLQAHKKTKEEAERSAEVDLSYAALWWMKADVSLQINGIQ